MKQKQLLQLVLVFLITNIIFVAGYISYPYFESITSDWDTNRWLFVLSFGGSIFIVIDTIEIMLLRHGQKGKQLGKTVIKGLESAYDELQKSPKAQEAFMILASNLFEAGFSDGVSDTKNPGGRSPKIQLPEKVKWAEGIVNQPSVKKKIMDRINGALEGGQGKDPSRSPDQGFE